jgi:dihydrofolate reductase
MYQDEADTILLGRRTYQEFAAYWPNKTAADDPFADYVNRTQARRAQDPEDRRMGEHDLDHGRRG